MAANNMVTNKIKGQVTEKELYSKECVAESIKFSVGKASCEVSRKNEMEKFSCNLATILARDQEVVAVWLECLHEGYMVWLSKNSAWLENDVTYIRKIASHLGNISANAPTISRESEIALTVDIVTYCMTKLESRLEKLKNDIIKGQNFDDVKSFMDNTLINANNIEQIQTATLSNICHKYYHEVKENSTIHPKFLGHIKKVGSYAGSTKDIIACARNIKYKTFFSKFQVRRMNPIIVTDQPIFSWESIIRSFVDDNEYKNFKDKCLGNEHIMERIQKIYADKTTNQPKQPQLDGDIKRRIYLHAEMNILAYIISKEIRRKVFIAVSKRCCYLCELYIDFARKNGYDVIIPGKHGKIYSGWKLPPVADNNFKIGSLIYILEHLDRIIENELSSVSAASDNDDLYDDYDAYAKYVL